MKDGPGELVASFSAIELNEDTPSIALVINEAQEVQCLY
jgi:hypothetical protein